MTATSEARKRQAERVAAVHERRREITRQALECVFPGADWVDADSFLLALEDFGGKVEVQP